MKSFTLLGFCLLHILGLRQVLGNNGGPGVVSSPKGWSAANQTCKSGLIVLDTKQKIKHMLTNEPLIQEKEKYWVGLRITDNNNLEWINGAIGKANIRKRNARNCFYFRAKWNCKIGNLQYPKCFKSANCSSPYKFICGNSSHTVVSNPKGWSAANQTCKSGLIVLDTEQKILDMLKNVTITGDKYWVGLRINADNYKLEWINGAKGKANIRKWNARNCFYFKRKGNCKIKNLHYSKCFKLDNCSSPYKFICGNSSHTGQASTISTDKAATTSLSSRIEIKSTAASAVSSTIKLYPTSSTLNDKIQPTFSMRTTSIHFASASTASLNAKSSSVVKPMIYPTTSLHRLSSTIEEGNLATTENNLESSSLQTPSLHLSSSSASFYMKKSMSSVINPMKASSLYPSTTVNPDPSQSSSSNRDMVNNFRRFIRNLNASDPDCMTILLNKYKNLTELIDEQEDNMKYNPLTDAQSIENVALEFAKFHLSLNRTSVNISNKDIAFYAKLVASDIDSDVVFPEAREDSNTNTISLPKSLFRGQENTYVISVVFKNNKTIRELTPTMMEGHTDGKNWLINTEIFSTTIFPKKSEPFEKVLIKLQHVQKTEDAKPHCSFWNFSIPSSYNGSWSEQGCHVVSFTKEHTVCACDHLTSFAVLMQLRADQPSEVHRRVLSIITYIGLGLSLLGEVITVLLYCIFLNLRNEKIQIRVNLLCALAAAQIVFLAGIDKTANKDVCMSVAAVIHLSYLVCFCWMLMEGVYLYRMVVKVFDAHITMRYSYLFALGFPSCILAVSLIIASVKTGGIYSYIHYNYCWIRFDNGLIWCFVGPVLLLIAINSFFLFSALKEMATMKSVKTINSFELSSIKASARACVLLLPLLGITWLFGLLSLVIDGIEWQYVFTILNATQGFMIFIFHCLRNTELRAAMELRYFQWESNHSNNRSSHGRVTPSRDGKILAVEESSKGSRSNSIPMATKVNKVSSE